MAHEINRMIYVGQEPWHGLGVRLPANGTFEEIVQAAGFYKAIERHVFVAGHFDPILDKKALVRGDNGQYLSVVGKGYQVVQFEDVAKTLVEAAGDVKAVFHTAGTLGPVGIRGWLLGELPDPIVVKGDPSPIRKFILGTSGHDGLTPIIIKNVATRVVCANTLGTALGERGGATWRIAHTANANQRLLEAARAFRELVKSYERLGELANFLAVTRFSESQMQSTVDRLMPLPRDDKHHTRLAREREKVVQLFDTAIGIEGEIRGTAWAALQGWTEYADHHRPQRSVSDLPANLVRLQSIWLGRAAELKQAALTAVADEARIQLAA